MKAQIAAKYLQFISKKNANKNAGFTLIELLVVIIIIGILSAIALPSFLNQAAKARASEARTNVGAVNRAQQAYYLENQTFVANASTVPTELGLGIANSGNYTYASVAADPAVSVLNNATFVKTDLKSYSGGVFKTAGATQAILCETNATGVVPVVPTVSTACPTGSKQLN